MPCVLFGSISTLADTSELQRRSFNEAFAAHGLDWTWDREEYRTLLEHSGGEDRIAAYAESAGDEVDAGAVHRSKSEHFQRHLAESRSALRSGVAQTIREAKERGFGVGLVTTTSGGNVSALLEGLRGEVASDDFDVIVDSSSVEQPKPHKAAYVYALEALDSPAGECVAIEDNLGGVAAAGSAGVACIAFPNENTAGHDFGSADLLVERLSFSDVQSSVSGS